MDLIIDGMIYVGSALMLFNIIGFLRFAHQNGKLENWGKNRFVLYFPVVLLVLFLLGYLAVGIFGKPDLIVSGILFGGSIFVFVMYLTLNGITGKISESEHLRAKLMAAEESSRSKTEFLSSVSHEMRTPMNVIIGLDAQALRKENLDPDTRVILEKIGQSSRGLLGLINNILELNGEGGDDGGSAREFSLDELTAGLCGSADAELLYSTLRKHLRPKTEPGKADIRETDTEGSR
ncbi:MAG: hypothetical protein IJU75_07395 [Clostridia bacterium]|nr:hypothetical protein [Clostridia bacterium]